MNGLKMRGFVGTWMVHRKRLKKDRETTDGDESRANYSIRTTIWSGNSSILRRYSTVYLLGYCQPDYLRW
jgi:hypothetical protein